MTRSVAARALACVIVALATIRCADSTAPRQLDNPIGVILSGLNPRPAATAGVAESPGVITEGVAYVSLPPGTVPVGITATITNDATGFVVNTPIVNGGFDPVSIGANVGDTLAVDISTSGNAVHALLMVAARRPPRIVRTSPPAGGRDVPLNATIMVVFSEPIDSASLTSGITLLSHDTVHVTGAVGFVDTAQFRVELQPGSQLAPLTTYTLVVTQAIRDLNGVTLDSPARLSFTTVAATGASASVAIQPWSATIILGDTTRLVATLTDSAGNLVPGKVEWSTNAPNVASVASTGLVTGTGLGHAFVFAVSGRDSVGANVWVQPPGPAEPPSGRIAFVNSGQLYIVNVDGSGLIQLTHDSASYSRPAWSPAAARIAAVRNGQGIVVMNVDGSGAVLVAPGGVSPAWSVDGARVRYAKALRDSLVEIDEVTPDGSQTTTLCAGVFGGAYYRADHMDWSPDRTTAAFELETFLSGPTGDPMLTVFLNDDHCTGAHPLDPGGGGSPAWSPDGQRIAYWSAGPGYSDGTTTWWVNGIFTTSSSGTGSRTFVFHDDGGYMTVYWPDRFSWSPDGRYMAFVRYQDWRGLQGHAQEIWITPGDGTGVPRRIGATGLQGSDPAWAPR